MLITCKATGRTFNNVKSYQNHLFPRMGDRTKVYESTEIAYITDILEGEIPKCIICGCKPKFISLSKGYNDLCNSKDCLKEKQSRTAKGRGSKDWSNQEYLDFILNNFDLYKEIYKMKNILDPFYNTNCGGIPLSQFIIRKLGILHKQLKKDYFCRFCNKRLGDYWIFADKQPKQRCSKKECVTLDRKEYFLNSDKYKSKSDKDKEKYELKKTQKEKYKIWICPETNIKLLLSIRSNSVKKHCEKYKLDYTDYMVKYFPELVGRCKVCNKITKIYNPKYEERNWLKPFCSEEHYHLHQSTNFEEYAPSDEQRKKLSDNMKARIASGEFTPYVTNSWANSRVKIKVKGTEYQFRSTWEALFWLLNKNCKYEKIRIPYFDSVKQTKRNYIVDFVDEERGILYEIKPKSNQITQNCIDKTEAAMKFCNDSQYRYVYITESFFIGRVDELLKLNLKDDKLIRSIRTFKNAKDKMFCML